ncbi:MAG: glycosyltransferase family A protein [Nostoc sp.]|uniref:glycosyltransferase family 2 protein n=1 Tax=Nostoc sp. TaxID=1180 RepID=UPI002FFD3ED9
MEPTPKVSVIIPAYNAMSFLPQALDTLFNQTFQDFEVLIIDDGSSDHIATWAAEITHPNVKLISQANQGQSVARNNGIRLSQSEYIAFLDADDLWEPTKLEKQVSAFIKNPELGLVDTWVFVVDEQDNILSKPEIYYDEGNVWLQMLELNLVMCGSSPMVRRECFETVGYFNQTIKGPEDWHMWTRIAAQYPFKIICEPLVHYRQHPHSTSRNLELMVSNIIKAIEDLFESVPLQFQWKKRRAYGRGYLYIASLAQKSNNYRQASYFFWRALLTYPQFCFSKDKLGFIINNLIHWGLEHQSNHKVNRLIQRIRDYRSKNSLKNLVNY